MSEHTENLVARLKAARDVALVDSDSLAGEFYSEPDEQTQQMQAQRAELTAVVRDVVAQLRRCVGGRVMTQKDHVEAIDTFLASVRSHATEVGSTVTINVLRPTVPYWDLGPCARHAKGKTTTYIIEVIEPGDPIAEMLQADAEKEGWEFMLRESFVSGCCEKCGPWCCEKCGSRRWVGWREGPADEDYKRFAQCVACGYVQDLPEGAAS